MTAMRAQTGRRIMLAGFRAVSLDRAFYRPLSAAQYAGYATQVSEDFRFNVKGPALVTDATVRSETGRAVQLNPASGAAGGAAGLAGRPAMRWPGPRCAACGLAGLTRK